MASTLPSPDSPPRIGQLIQSLRTERGMTLEDLSRIAGVSKSMLSEIERDKANPTIAVTWRLANAFGMGLDQLFASTLDTEPAIQVMNIHETPTLNGPQSNYQLKILGPMHLAGKFEWYGLDLAVAGALCSNAHDPGTEEHLTVYEGEVTIEQGTHQKTVKAGETARYRADIDHAIRNAGETPVRALLVVIHGG
ncbi:helix-turn-helix domain-containing protein [Leeia oryzae]|uniref:helix-turn-helix domain-containing protein n=1 Tax=Leeia oryzae TaxID=356662 RepID=UPI0003A95BF0|nr:XRE family transcriptional regulator [Leeia oryzae]